MADYKLETKDEFTVLGIGTELISDYRDFEGINREKQAFWASIKQDGRLEKLKQVASNAYLFAVNEAVNNKMMYYAGVLTEENLSDATRMIQFPKGEYVVVGGEAATTEELSNTLAGIAFGQVLSEVEGVAYVGGPNAVVEMGERDGRVYGEIWIPVVQK
ncbi:GyrI-like domain-containing protein [Listeria aquatica]|uniref:GyrI-like domain-containing protein n=1 Tax=Listeria aquatica TaxID=1494960 RepID=UPI003EF58623